MALTNYLAQTALGVLVLTVLLGDADWANRSVVLAFVVAVWAAATVVVAGRGWAAFLFGPMGVVLASRHVPQRPAAPPPGGSAARGVEDD